MFSNVIYKKVLPFVDIYVVTAVTVVVGTVVVGSGEIVFEVCALVGVGSVVVVEAVFGAIVVVESVVVPYLLLKLSLAP